MTTIVEARIVSERLWARNPLAWLESARNAELLYLTLLQYIARRIDCYRGKR